LISHQAGFTDPIPISWIHLADEDADFDGDKFVSQTIARHSRQISRPGDKFKYSSIGYLILSLIIEKLSGMPYDQYVIQNVIPNLSESERLSYSIGHKEHHAVGYHPRYAISNLLLSIYLDKKKFVSGYQGRWMSFKNFYVNGKAYGGLIGNVRGLGRYLQTYLKHSLFSYRETQEQMFTLQNGKMCLGWFPGSLNEERFVCHAGGGGGYYCEIRIYPQIQLATAIMRNKSSFSDIRILDQIDRKTIFQNQK
jgi:CubicO group peptidase (beta-lactamase class C family)